jgi:tetratricopeptide (TPR) repeat protein
MRRVLEKVGSPGDAEWLLLAASARLEKAAVIIRLIEDMGWIPFLQRDTQMRLAAVYGDLAWHKRVDGGTQEEILSLANKALALNPQEEQGMIEKAVALYAQGQHQAGLVLLDQVVHLYPKSSNAWSVFATVELQEAHFQTAESAARRSLELGPSTFYREWSLASALYNQGRCEEALPHARLAQDLLGYDHPMYLRLMGDVYWCLGDLDKASEVYQRLEKIDPKYAPYVRDRIGSTR